MDVFAYLQFSQKSRGILRTHVHPKDITLLCWCFEIFSAFDNVIFGFSVCAKFNAARNVFWVNMGLYLRNGGGNVENKLAYFTTCACADEIPGTQGKQNKKTGTSK